MFTGNAILKVYFAFHQSLEGHFLTQSIQKGVLNLSTIQTLLHQNRMLSSGREPLVIVNP